MMPLLFLNPSTQGFPTGDGAKDDFHTDWVSFRKQTWVTSSERRSPEPEKGKCWFAGDAAHNPANRG